MCRMVDTRARVGVHADINTITKSGIHRHIHYCYHPLQHHGKALTVSQSLSLSLSLSLLTLSLSHDVYKCGCLSLHILLTKHSHTPTKHVHTSSPQSTQTYNAMPIIISKFAHFFCPRLLHSCSSIGVPLTDIEVPYTHNLPPPSDMSHSFQHSGTLGAPPADFWP